MRFARAARDGRCVLAAEATVIDTPFLVLNADNLYPTDASDLWCHSASQASRH